MKQHVLAGDLLADDFRKTGIDGDVIVCRECFISGDANAETLPEFWEQRARFILGAFGEDEIAYHENVADELAKLLDLPEKTEVNLWFEYELFCQANMWFCLWLLSGSGAEVYRVEPLVRDKSERWKGFGGLNADELNECFAGRRKMSASDVELGASLWEAFRHRDSVRLRELSTAVSPAFSYLNEVCEAAIDLEERPIRILSELRAEGYEGLTEIFREFISRAGVYGFGDLQVQHLLNMLD